MTASNQRLFHATSSPHGTSSEYQVENGERGEEKEINEHSAGKRAKEGKEGTSKREEEERALFVVERAIQTRRGERNLQRRLFKRMFEIASAVLWLKTSDPKYWIVRNLA